MRAAAQALRWNPLPIVIPCHRIIRGDGTWGHYAFGGAMKTALLTLERTTPALVGGRVAGFMDHARPGPRVRHEDVQPATRAPACRSGAIGSFTRDWS